MSTRTILRLTPASLAPACAWSLAMLAFSAAAATGSVGTMPAPGPAASAVHGAPPWASGPAAHDARAARKKAPPAPVERIDINGASLKQLTTLPGVGKAEARKIIANRPYLSKAELVHKGVLPMGPYLSLKDRVIALQKSPPKPKS